MAVRSGNEIGYFDRETMEWITVAYVCPYCGNRIEDGERYVLYKGGQIPEYAHHKCVKEIVRYPYGECRNEVIDE